MDFLNGYGELLVRGREERGGFGVGLGREKGGLNWAFAEIFFGFLIGHFLFWGGRLWGISKEIG